MKQKIDRMSWSGFSRFYLIIALVTLTGSGFLWQTGRELFTEEREKAEALTPEEAAAGHGTRRHLPLIYGFGYYGYHGGK